MLPIPIRRFATRLIAAFAFLAPLAATSAESPDRVYDLVVVEATPGGIAMAVRAAREGLSVLLTNHTAHLGGILSSGLGVWDTQFEGRRSPIYDEVRQALFDYYRTTYGENSPQYHEALPGKSGHTNGKFEPRVIEKLFTDLVAREKNITVLSGFYPSAVERNGASLAAITFQQMGGSSIRRVQAKIFADCTYEGDLLPLAKVRYRLGREARTEFNEPHAGVIFMKTISPQPPTAALAELGRQHEKLKLRKFNGFQEILPGSTGAADQTVQAFNYRTMLSSDPANRMPAVKPDGYDPEDCKKLEWGSIVAPIPNQKLGWNRPQLLGPHNAYIEADWPKRQQIMDEFWRSTMALLYFMQNDPSVPAERRQEWQGYGLAKDEFPDNAHRPYEFYVREARRLAGRTVFTEHDATLAPGLHRAPAQTDGIAITEWYMDNHAHSRDRVPGSVDAGKMNLHQETFPGQIPYRTLLAPDLDNLLVPVCLSSTHVSWGTVRLEPTWMNITESAAFAAVQAVKHRQAPAAIDPDTLLRTLAAKHIMITFFNDVDVSRSDPWLPAAQYFGTKGFFSEYDAQMSEPLKAGTARAWAEAFADLQAGRLDAMAVMKKVAAAESGPDAPVSTEAFSALLKNPRAQIVGSGPVLTRGSAVEILWKALP